VLALKELSIRGDIRTTTEYLVDLLESSEYASNTFNTRSVATATAARCHALGCCLAVRFAPG
jgi:biotin carboxylase